MDNEEQVLPVELPGCGQMSRLLEFKVARSYKNIQ